MLRALGLLYIFEWTAATKAAVHETFQHMALPLVIIPEAKIAKLQDLLGNFTEALRQRPTATAIRPLQLLSLQVAGLLNFMLVSQSSRTIGLPLARSIRGFGTSNADVFSKEARQAVAANARQTLQLIRHLEPLSLAGGIVTQSLAHMFTDASLDDDEAFLGAILYFKTRVYAFSHRVSRSARPKRETIMLYEAWAVLVAFTLWGPLLRGSRVFAHIDNTADLFCFVKAESKERLTHVLIRESWRTIASFSISPFFLYVPSKENPGDDFTRVCDATRQEIFRSHSAVETVVPPSLVSFSTFAEVPGLAFLE